KDSTGSITKSLIQLTNSLYVAAELQTIYIEFSILLSNGTTINVPIRAAYSISDSASILLKITDTEILNVSATSISSILNQTTFARNLTTVNNDSVDWYSISSGIKRKFCTSLGENGQSLPDNFRIYQAPAGTTIVGTKFIGSHILILPK
ncbi:MAG: hypothetical protein ACRCX2_17535, partial [Paraclostridium sp.]